jgi:hypothetical protein
MEQTMGLLDRIQQIKDTEYFIKLLLYGPYGAGKTRFAASAPNPVWVDTERSAETFRRITELQSTPLFVPADFEEMFEFCREVVRKKAYETIVIDTIGRAQDDQVQSDLRKDAAIPGKPGQFKRSPYLPLWGDYRVSTNKIDEMFMFLQKANIHVIIIGHERRDYDKDSGELLRITPDITPTLKKSIMGLINIAAHLEISTDIKGNRERKLTVNPYQKIEAKNRLNIQETSIKNPNFNEIFLI